ncbi:MAG: RDD family protein [Solirubrobacterales bacterium]|nr:RDD family protein [Solirubrobacterales bacterium]
MDGDPETNGNIEEEDDPQTFAGRIVSGGTKRAQRAAGIAGIDRVIETAVEDAIVRAIESDATERAIARVLNGPAIEQAVKEALQSKEVEQALYDTLDSEMVDRLWARVLASDEAQQLIERIAEAPEVRAAIASQGIGLIGDIGRQIARVTCTLDLLGERFARRLLFRKKREVPTNHAGFFTRVLALILDAVIVNLSMVTLTALLSLIAAAFGASFNDSSKELLAVGAVSWFFVSSFYLFTFWSLSGQTPGMQFLDIRIEHEGDRHLGPRLAIRRLIGFWLAFIPFGLGFIGALVKIDRRGFHDRLGNTTVYYVDPARADEPHVDPALFPPE